MGGLRVGGGINLWGMGIGGYGGKRPLGQIGGTGMGEYQA